MSDPAMTTSPTIWSDPALAGALEALAGTISTSAIAAELSRRFGVPITRNSVIGRINRTGLPRLAPHGAGVPRPTLRRGATKPPATKPKATPRPKPKVEPILNRSAEATKAYGEPCSLVECPWCMWPINDVPRGHTFLFCNAVKAEGQCYCPTHHALSISS